MCKRENTNFARLQIYAIFDIWIETCRKFAKQAHETLQMMRAKFGFPKNEICGYYLRAHYSNARAAFHVKFIKVYQ